MIQEQICGTPGYYSLEYLIKILSALCELLIAFNGQPMVLRYPGREPLESILPNFDFFIFLIFTLMLGHFKVQAIFSYATNTLA